MYCKELSAWVVVLKAGRKRHRITPESSKLYSQCHPFLQFYIRHFFLNSSLLLYPPLWSPQTSLPLQLILTSLPSFLLIFPSLLVIKATPSSLSSHIKLPQNPAPMSLQRNFYLLDAERSYAGDSLSHNIRAAFGGFRGFLNRDTTLVSCTKHLMQQYPDLSVSVT